MGSKNLETLMRLSGNAEFEEHNTSEKSRQAIYAELTDDFECHEPPSLPHGGVHKGKDAWAAMNEQMGEYWDQQVVAEHTLDIPEKDLIVLTSTMTWKAHSTGKSVTFPAVELLWFRDAKLARVDVFLQDTKEIMATLDSDA